MKRMRLFLLLGIFNICHTVFAQNLMVIHQGNGTKLQIPLESIDSVRFATVPPPNRQKIFQNNGNILSLSVADIDSITYIIPNTQALAGVSTQSVTVLSSSSAYGGGLVSSNGGSAVTQRGLCWSTSPNPTLANNFTVDGAGTGSFGSTMAPLQAATTYYVRAYAINSEGTAYGNAVVFTTSNPSVSGLLATISTANVVYTSGLTANCGGNITADGGLAVTARGVCWAAGTTPTINHNHTVDDAGAGSFSSTLTNLLPNTTYFVRAYATNDAGTAYGQEISFSTIDFSNIRAMLSGGSRKTWILDGSQGANSITVGIEANPTFYYVGGPLAPCQINDEYTFTSTDSLYINFNANALIYGGPGNYNCGPYSLGGTKFMLGPVAAFPGLAQIVLNNGRVGENVSDGEYFIGVMDNVQNLYRILSLSPTNLVIRVGDGSGPVQTLKFIPKNNATSLAILSTNPISLISTMTATSGGNVTFGGGGNITAQGICYSTSQNPTISDFKTIDGGGTGVFVSLLTGLNSNTTYYVRAYATNSLGTAYGNQVTFKTLAQILFNPNLSYGTMSDIDGNNYKTIVIGTQTWMAENLKVSKYRNGNVIPTNLTDAAWGAATTGAYSIYNNDVANNAIYGKLYNWYAVVDSRNLCPVGWHIPSDTEWKTLEISLGMSASDADLTGGRGAAQNIGGKLRSTSSLWNAPNTSATNEYGFSGLPGASRNHNGTYSGVGDSGYWWSSTAESSFSSWVRFLYFGLRSSNRSASSEGHGFKQNGHSVRCLKD